MLGTSERALKTGGLIDSIRLPDLFLSLNLLKINFSIMGDRLTFGGIEPDGSGLSRLMWAKIKQLDETDIK